MKTVEDLDNLLEKIKLPFKLVDLQREDVMTAYHADRFAFFYEVGGGKTVVSTLTSLLWETDHVLVVVPPILQVQWQAWLNKIGETDNEIFIGPKRTTAMLGFKWVIMSHAIFRDSYKVIEQFYRGKSAMILLDEAQAAKNPRSILFRSINSFLAPDRHCLMLTGTPTSKPEDTFTYMKIKTPALYRGFGHWKNVHVAEEDHFGAIKAYSNLDMLAKNFALKAVTRTKKDLFNNDMVPIYQPMPYNLSKAHYKLYLKLAEEQLLILDDGGKIDATTSQRLHHALQQIVMNFDVFSGNPEDRSAGYDLLDQVIDEVDPMNPANSKLAIWTYYVNTSRGVTKYLKDKFGEKAVACAYGKVDSKKGVAQIMNDPECRFIVAQPGSAGVGLELQFVCHQMLFLELSTSPIQIKQTIGRVARTGQTVVPTIRFGQAIGTNQLKLFNRLLDNADLTEIVEQTATSFRAEILGTG